VAELGDNPGKNETELNKPRAAVIDADGDYVIADTEHHCDQLCSASSPGAACTTVPGAGSKGSSSLQLHKPLGIVVVTIATTASTSTSTTNTTTTSNVPTTASINMIVTTCHVRFWTPPRAGSHRVLDVLPGLVLLREANAVFTVATSRRLDACAPLRREGGQRQKTGVRWQMDREALATFHSHLAQDLKGTRKSCESHAALRASEWMGERFDLGVDPHRGNESNNFQRRLIDGDLPHLHSESASYVPSNDPLVSRSRHLSRDCYDVSPIRTCPKLSATRTHHRWLRGLVTHNALHRFVKRSQRMEAVMYAIHLARTPQFRNHVPPTAHAAGDLGS